MAQQRYLTYQYKAHIRRGDYFRLDEALRHSATVYNAALEECTQAYRMQRKAVTLYDQTKQFKLIRQDMPEWSAYHYKLGAGVLVRVDRAMQAFFKRVKRGEKPGYPRYRSARRYQTLEVSEVTTGMLKRSPDGRRAYIRIKGLPTLTLRTKRPLPEGKPRTLMISRRASGYVVSMACALECDALPESDDQVGIDMGVNERMTLSTGERLARKVHDRRRERRLRRRVARAQKGSQSRRNKVRTLSRETYRNTIRNRNVCHRASTELVRRFGRLAVEGLRIRNMTRSAAGTVEESGRNDAQKTGLNRSITEQTWGIIHHQLAYKAEYAGRELVKVNPAYTSRTCSSCGVIRMEKLVIRDNEICRRVASQWVLPKLRREPDGRRDQRSDTDRGTQGYSQPVQGCVEEGQEPDARRVRSHGGLPQKACGQASEARR